MRCSCGEEFVQGDTMVLVMQHSFTVSQRSAELLCLHCAAPALVKLARTARAEAQYDTSPEGGLPEVAEVAVPALTQAERDATSTYRHWDYDVT